MNTYVWKIQKLEVAPQEGALVDVVRGVHYTVTAVAEDGITAGGYGSVGLNAPGEDFTAYADLTETQIVSWVQAAINAEPPQEGEEAVDRVADIHAALDRQIEYTRNPPVVSKQVPWG